MQLLACALTASFGGSRRWWQYSIPTDTIPTNAISTEIHVDRHFVTLYIHQGATISCVMEYDFAFNIKIA